MKRVGGGYREVPYTAAELLEVAASLGMQLRATAEERDRILRERSSLQDHSYEASTHLTTIEQLRIQIEELRQQQASSLSSSHIRPPASRRPSLPRRHRARLIPFLQSCANDEPPDVWQFSRSDNSAIESEILVAGVLAVR